MRLGLISLDRQGWEAAEDKGFGGRSIAADQLQMALSAGCERILCFAREETDQLHELKQQADEADIPFAQARTVAALCSESAAAETVLIFANAVLPDAGAVEGLKFVGILAFPAENAVPLGYERIDAPRAWAGVMLSPGVVAEGLADLPDDIDPVATWLRLALQAGVDIVSLDPDMLQDGRWSLRPDAEALAAREKLWIAAHAKPVDFRAPGLAVAEKAGLRLASDIANSPYRNAPTLTATALLLCALGLAALALPFPAFLLVGLAFVSSRIGRVIHRVARPGMRNQRYLSLDHLTDLTIAVVLVLSAPQGASWLGGFVPAVLIGMLHLARTGGPTGLRIAAEDRSVLAVLLAGAAMFGAAFEAGAVIALLLLVWLVVDRREENVAE